MAPSETVCYTVSLVVTHLPDGHFLRTRVADCRFNHKMTNFNHPICHFCHLALNILTSAPLTISLSEHHQLLSLTWRPTPGPCSSSRPHPSLTRITRHPVTPVPGPATGPSGANPTLSSPAGPVRPKQSQVTDVSRQAHFLVGWQVLTFVMKLIQSDGVTNKQSCPELNRDDPGVW